MILSSVAVIPAARHAALYRVAAIFSILAASSCLRWHYSVVSSPARMSASVFKRRFLGTYYRTGEEEMVEMEKRHSHYRDSLSTWRSSRKKIPHKYARRTTSKQNTLPEFSEYNKYKEMARNRLVSKLQTSCVYAINEGNDPSPSIHFLPAAFVRNTPAMWDMCVDEPYGCA